MSWETFTAGNNFKNHDAIAVDDGNTSTGFITNKQNNIFLYKESGPSTTETVVEMVQGKIIEQVTFNIIGIVTHIDREGFPGGGALIKPS